MIGCHFLGVQGQDCLDIAAWHVVSIVLVEEDAVEGEELFALKYFIAGVYRFLAAFTVIALGLSEGYRLKLVLSLRGDYWHFLLLQVDGTLPEQHILK